MRLIDSPLELPGVPAGLVARPLREYRPGEHGELIEVRDRRGRRKLDLVALCRADEPDDVRDGARWPSNVPTIHCAFLLGANRRQWATIATRLGDSAWELACELARAGVIRIVCRVDDRVAVGPPVRWDLSDDRAAQAAAGRSERRDRWRTWRDRAAAVAAALDETEVALAAVLTDADPGASSTHILVHAAEDLLSGTVHDGPRAFSQAHFGDTKTHAHVDAVLREAGVPVTTRQRLGVHRSQRLGVGGPVTLWRRSVRVELATLDGLLGLRADQPGLQMTLRPNTPLVIVENLQAGEALCDRHPDLAIAYTAGVPGEPSLGHIAALALKAPHVAVAPDADAGGVRIAEAILRSLGDHRDVELLDVGLSPHRAGAPWREDGPALRTLSRASDGLAASLANACLARGYAVEQEATTIATVDAWIRRTVQRPD